MSSYEVKAKRRVIVSQEREKDSKITPVVDQVSGKDGKVYRIENGMLRNLCEELTRKLTDHWSQRSELFNFREIRMSRKQTAGLLELIICRSFNTFCCYNFHLAGILVWAFRPPLCLEQAVIALFYCYGKSFKICSCSHSHVASIYLIC